MGQSAEKWQAVAICEGVEPYGEETMVLLCKEMGDMLDPEVPEDRVGFEV